MIADLERIDRALLKSRRFMEAPAVVDDEGRELETSTVLVLEALTIGHDTTVRGIALWLDVAHSTASRLVTRAEQAGMVERRPSPTNGRETLVVPTDRGRAVRRRAAEFRLGRLAQLTAEWTGAEVGEFGAALTRFADSASSASLRPSASERRPTRVRS